MNEIERELLNTHVKQVEKRIKEVQEEAKDAYTQEDVCIKQGIERELINWKISLEKWRELINWKISLEKWRKKLKYSLSENN